MSTSKRSAVLAHGKLTGTQVTPGRKEGQQLVKKVQEKLKVVTDRMDEEMEALERGERRVEDFAWEDELEPHHRKRR